MEGEFGPLAFKSLVIEVSESGVDSIADCLNQPRLYDEGAIRKFDGDRKKKGEVFALAEPFRCLVVERAVGDRELVVTAPAEDRPIGIAVGPSGQSLDDVMEPRVIVSAEVKKFLSDSAPGWFSFDDELAKN